jgi:hypothetical protein
MTAEGKGRPMPYSVTIADDVPPTFLIALGELAARCGLRVTMDGGALALAAGAAPPVAASSPPPPPEAPEQADTEPRRKRVPSGEVREAIYTLFGEGQEFSLREVMDATGAPRASVAKVVQAEVDAKRVAFAGAGEPVSGSGAPPKLYAVVAPEATVHELRRGDGA